MNAIDSSSFKRWTTQWPHRRGWLLFLFLCGWSSGCDTKPAVPDDAVLTQALQWLDDGQVAAAEQALREYWKAHPDSQLAQDELRWLCFHQFRFRDVEQIARAGVERHPGDPIYLVHAMMTRFRPPVPQEGLAQLESIQQRHPGQLRVLVGLAYANWHLGELERASEFFNQALQQSPADHETRLLAAEFLIERNQYETAVKLLEFPADPMGSAPAYFEPDDRWWWLWCQVDIARDQWDPALEHVRQALFRRPGEIRYVQRQGLILQRLQQATAAAEVFQHAQELEAHQMALNEFVLSGAVQSPSADQCIEAAGHCEALGWNWLATGWRLRSDRLRSGRPPSTDSHHP